MSDAWNEIFAVPDTKPKSVPWAHKQYAEIVDAGMLDQVKDWCKLDNWGSDDVAKEKRDEYVLYLKNFCGFPKEFSP